jgi:uncharacterized tellurite resistance protein B-like protein
MDKILLKTALCCMACDGNFQKEEVDTLYKSSLKEFGKEVIESEIEMLNAAGKVYLKDFIDSLSAYKGNDEISKKILNIAAEIIKADNVIEYSEIKFFKLIVNALGVSEQFVLDNVSDIDEDWVEEDFMQSKDEAYRKFFEGAMVPKYNFEINPEMFKDEVENQK